jgi:hypothetical protein
VPLLLVLNELSYKEGQVHSDKLSASIHELVQLIRCIRRHRDDSVLATEAGLFDLEIATGYTMRAWAADGRNRTAMQYLKSVRQRAPFQGIAPPNLEGVAEYRHRGRSAEGLGLAHLVGGLGLSLNLDDDWRTTSVVLDRTALEENADGQLVLIESQVDVRHAATEDHVTEHERWLCDEGIAHVRTGDGLWRVCADVFPNLVFLPRVQDNLAGLRAEWIEPVKERLAELQTATARWDVAANPTPEWLSHVTPESQSRRQLCQFVDLDGTVRLFETHARFTPGAGRIYFRMDGAKGKLVIAHIGRKL